MIKKQTLWNHSYKYCLFFPILYNTTDINKRSNPEERDPTATSIDGIEKYLVSLKIVATMIVKTSPIVTKINPATNKQETIEVKKTVKAPVSTVGFTNRKVEITEEFYTSSLPSSVDIDIEGFKLIEKGYDLVLKHPPINFIDVDARAYNSDGINFYEYNWSYVAQLQGQHNIRPAFTPPKNVLIMPKELDSNVLNINVISITYVILEKLDPSVKG